MLLPVDDFSCFVLVKEADVLRQDAREQVLSESGGHPLPSAGQERDVSEGQHSLQGEITQRFTLRNKLDLV